MGVSIGAIRWDSFHSGLTDVAIRPILRANA